MSNDTQARPDGAETHALDRARLDRLEHMVGLTVELVEDIAPAGPSRVKGELEALYAQVAIAGAQHDPDERDSVARVLPYSASCLCGWIVRTETQAAAQALVPVHLHEVHRAFVDRAPHLAGEVPA